MDHKVIQINLGKGKAAGMLLIRKLKDFDIALIQEPGSKFKGPLGFNTFKCREEAKAVTLIRNGIGKVWMRKEISSENVVVIEIEIQGMEGSMMIVNVYDEPPDAGNTASRFRDLERWLRSRQERMFIAGDMNAKNLAWGGRTNDLRGVDLLERAIMNGWKIENEPDDPPSFYSNRGQSWVDLVISKGVKVKDRMVDANAESMSDHRYIEYTGLFTIYDTEHCGYGFRDRNKKIWG